MSWIDCFCAVRFPFIHQSMLRCLCAAVDRAKKVVTEEDFKELPWLRFKIPFNIGQTLYRAGKARDALQSFAEADRVIAMDRETPESCKPAVHYFTALCHAALVCHASELVPFCVFPISAHSAPAQSSSSWWCEVLALLNYLWMYWEFLKTSNLCCLF